MLPYALAVVVGLSSSVLFVTAFFFPDIHRQDDFLWSGVGLFYALVLWFCASSISGAILLGQVAVVALLSAYFWQVFKLRDAIANPNKQTDLDNFSVVSSLQNLFSRSSKVASVPTTEEISDTVIETKEEPATNSLDVDGDIAGETADTVIETKEEPVVIQKVSLKPVDRPSSMALEEESPGNTDKEQTPLSQTNLNEVIDEAKPAKVEPPEAAKPTPKVTEITVEKITIVEEETNWDDDVEDIPASAVTIVSEETPTETTDDFAEESKEG